MLSTCINAHIYSRFNLPRVLRCLSPSCLVVWGVRAVGSDRTKVEVENIANTTILDKLSNVVHGVHEGKVFGYHDNGFGALGELDNLTSVLKVVSCK